MDRRGFLKALLTGAVVVAAPQIALGGNHPSVPRIGLSLGGNDLRPGRYVFSIWINRNDGLGWAREMKEIEHIGGELTALVDVKSGDLVGDMQLNNTAWPVSYNEDEPEPWLTLEGCGGNVVLKPEATVTATDPLFAFAEDSFNYLEIT